MTGGEATSHGTDGRSRDAGSLKSRLRTGRPAWGCFVRYPDPSLVEFVALQGWDFMVFDGEHGSLEPRDWENLARSAELRGVAALGRVRTNSPSVLLRALDTGLIGLHVPMVDDVADAAGAVRAAKYHPLGARGLGGSRAAAYGQREPLRDYVVRANESTMVIAHIETREALENIEEIASVEGIDVVFLGPTDLSQAYGVPGQTDHPAVEAALDAAARACARTDCALGVMVTSANDAVGWAEKGATYIAVTFEAVVGAAMRAYLDAAAGASAL